MKVDIFTDGACSGNPGPGGVGVVILAEGRVLSELAVPIGECTNNIAEYTALIYALKEAKRLGASEVAVKSDSELMCRQIAGQYKVKQPHLLPLFDEVKKLSTGFKRFSLNHVRREENAHADRLSRQAIEGKTGQDGRPAAAGSREESPSSKG